MKRYANVLVSRKKIEWIADKYVLSAHAEMQVIRRGREGDDLRKRILNTSLAWKTKDGLYAIALDLYRYVVVNSYKEPDRRPVIITLIDTEPSGCNVIDKMLMSYRENCREVEKESYSNVWEGK